MASSLPVLTTLSYSFPKPSVIHVELNRPKNLNSMNKTLFSELKQLFTALNQYEDLRVVVLTGAGKGFTAGLDLIEAPSIFVFDEVKSSSPSPFSFPPHIFLLAIGSSQKEYSTLQFDQRLAGKPLLHPKVKGPCHCRNP